MERRSDRPADDEIEEVVTVYANMLFKLCFTILCNSTDAEDAVSDTFVKWITKAPSFRNEEHRKAWLIRVATNICLDMRRFHKRHPSICLDEVYGYCQQETGYTILKDILSLPAKYKTVLYLFYIEGYQTEEIAKLLSISGSAVRKRLQYGRDMLKLEYRKDGLL